jgi:hypothetical protein
MNPADFLRLLLVIAAMLATAALFVAMMACVAACHF